MKKLWILGALAFMPAVLPTVAQAKQPYQEYVAERIERRIEDDYRLRPFAFKTQTVGTQIHLRGTVRTQAQRRLAYNIARKYSRGFPIVNYILVRPGISR